MANIQQFTVVRNGTVNISAFPRYTITARVEEVNPATGLMETVVGGDMTGANALTFPGVLTTLTAAQRDDFVQMVATWLVRTKAGLPT